ncbi:histidine phosphatase family protein [Rhodoferax sp. AJA081-3]|uniref:histidine phosphatase family protein n=1 Tax=Rhodoferax sp. AJA081-3 TaxID=2752316 RepID=UPI001AE0D534|nr:histidine phosphatase family protein [Rhodoferax sp. AJA081-3]QTN28257.1 histidine phosphatase family protein [Rhodoferax sp. AJA081-3]
MTSLLLVRHGQTQFNAEHRYLGALDPDLNAQGIAQARALRETLPAQLDAVLCSPLRRAYQTAEIICEGRGWMPQVHDAFRERHVGVFEGLTQKEAQTLYPDLWAQNITRQWHAAPIGGETISEVVERVSRGLRDIAEQHKDQTVVLVAHGFVAKVIRAVNHVGFDDFFDWQLENGAVLKLDVVVTSRTSGGSPLPPT